MPMRYAHRDDVLRQLELTADDPAVSEVEHVENMVADVFDGIMGRSFSAEDLLPETRIARGLASDLLVLPVGVRSVIGVAVGGTWDGLVWADETQLSPGDWSLWGIGADGAALGLLAHTGVWTGTVRVTALWVDQPVSGVPDDVRGAATYVTVKHYRRQDASSENMIGPDGVLIPTPHGMNDPLVKAALARNTIRRRRVGV